MAKLTVTKVVFLLTLFVSLSSAQATDSKEDLRSQTDKAVSQVLKNSENYRAGVIDGKKFILATGSIVGLSRKLAELNGHLDANVETQNYCYEKISQLIRNINVPMMQRRFILLGLIKLMTSEPSQFASISLTRAIGSVLRFELRAVKHYPAESELLHILKTYYEDFKNQFIFMKALSLRIDQLTTILKKDGRLISSTNLVWIRHMVMEIHDYINSEDAIKKYGEQATSDFRKFLIEKIPEAMKSFLPNCNQMLLFEKPVISNTHQHVEPSAFTEQP